MYRFADKHSSASISIREYSLWVNPGFNMPETSKQGEHEVHAFTHNIGPFVVFFHNIAPAELTQGQPPASSVGTGFLVQFRGRKYFVSALHNFFYEALRSTGGHQLM